MADNSSNSDMKVNNLLYEADLLDDFFRAANKNKKDREEMIGILMSVDLERPEAEKTVDKIMANHAFSE